MPIKTSINEQILTLGLLITGFVCYVFFTASIFFFFNIVISEISSVIITLSYVIVCFLYLNKQYSDNTIIKLLLSTVLIVVLCFAINAYFIDYSYDGQSYHGEAIIQFYNGWNPNFEYVFNDDKSNIIHLVINHFAKASWICGAVFYKITGIFECAKSANLILMIGNLFVAFYFFNRFFSIIISILLASLLAFNPVSLNMYLGNMLDSQIANLTYVFIILLYLILKEKRRDVIPFLYLVIIYIVNLKFTVVGYMFIYYFAFAIVILILYRTKENILLLFKIGLCSLLAVFIFGYNTYTKNFIQNEHPFYPFRGNNPIANNTIVEALDYKSGSRVINFIKSNFASTTYNQAYSQPLKYKIPFSVSKYELERFAFSGVMIGGFGVWYSGILLICLVMFLFLYFKNAKIFLKENVEVLVIIATIFITIIINPLGYIARYIPQYYIIPFMVILLFNKYYPLNKWPVKILLFAMMINSILISGYSYYNIIVSNKVKSQMSKLKQDNKELLVKFSPHTSKRVLFDNYKISYKQVDSIPSGLIPDTLFRSEVVYVVK